MLVTRKLRFFTNGLGIKFEIKTKAIKPHSNVSYLILTPILSLEYLEFNSISRHRSRALKISRNVR